MNNRRHILRSVTLGFLGFIIVYVGSFYLFMVPNCPALDDSANEVFVHCPRFSRDVRYPGPLTIDSGHWNFLNYVYYPFELLTRAGFHVPPAAPNKTSNKAGAGNGAR